MRSRSPPPSRLLRCSVRALESRAAGLFLRIRLCCAPSQLNQLLQSLYLRTSVSQFTEAEKTMNFIFKCPSLPDSPAASRISSHTLATTSTVSLAAPHDLSACPSHAPCEIAALSTLWSAPDSAHFPPSARRSPPSTLASPARSNQSAPDTPS